MPHKAMNDDSRRKTHWENLYKSKQLHELGWYQSKPETSLDFVDQFNLPKDVKIIDIGGGDSYFVDHLIELGYGDITVLDISHTALEKAKKRLGAQSSTVKWIVGDASTYKHSEKYDFWHDRAAFHFLLEEDEIERYIDNVRHCIKPGGVLIIGTFSEQGPRRCSGLEIKQYSEKTLNEKLEESFEKVKCLPVDHTTPQGNIQKFIFCSFRKKV